MPITPDTFPIASYCSSLAWGGLEMNVLRFLGWMQQRGWPVRLYAHPDSTLFTRAIASHIPVRALPSNSKFSDLLRSRSFARFIAEDSIRVLTFHQSRDLVMAVMTKRSTGGRLKLIYSQHMHIAGDKTDFLHAWLFRHLDALVPPVPFLARQVLARTVLTESQIHVIPQGIEIDRFLNLPPRAEARRQLDLPPDLPIAGVIGRLDPKKGQHVALKALGRLHATDLTPHLLIVGSQTLGEPTNYEASLRQLVADLHLENFVHFRPHLEDPLLAYAAMDLFVLPSLSETYGMVTIEAMASGLPVIGTDSGGTTDLIDHERTGLLVPPDDDLALAGALRHGLCDLAAARAMGARARDEAVARFSHDTQCLGWEVLLRSLLS